MSDPYAPRVGFKNPTGPGTAAIPKQPYEQAMRVLPTYVAQRWAQMPPAFITGMAMAWLQFQELDEAEKMAVFVQLYRRSKVLAIDRANQLVDVHSCK